MATSIADLRKMRSSNLSKIVEEMDKKNNFKEDDKRFWKLSRDKTGNGQAIIRFLQSADAEKLPFKKIFKYGFKGSNGKWYINDSPSTIGLPDPVFEYNGECFASKDVDRIEDAKTRKRQTKYVSNILVVKDPANPENEGKVFLFEYGPKIFDMITSKIKPEFEEDEAIDVWSFWDGCNFKLRIKTVKDYPNYDSSEWMGQSVLFGDDDKKLQALIDQMFDLDEFHDPKRFKTYEQLKKDFERVMVSGGTIPAAERVQKENKQTQEFDDVPDFEPVVAKKKEQPPASGDDDDGLKYLESLLND